LKHPSVNPVRCSGCFVRLPQRLAVEL
jgi:hypothetical protein